MRVNFAAQIGIRTFVNQTCKKIKLQRTENLFHPVSTQPFCRRVK
jgi:hypothetical protein